MQFSITEICLRRAFASRMVDTSTLVSSSSVGHVDIKVQSYNNNIMSNLTFSGYSVQITVFSAMSMYAVIETEVNLTNRGGEKVVLLMSMSSSANKQKCVTQYCMKYGKQ